MAIPTFRITAYFVDSEGHEWESHLYWNGQLADVQVLQETWKTLFAVTTVCTVQRVEVTLLDQSPILSLPSGNVDGEIRGDFAFYNQDGKVTKIPIPGINPQVVREGSNELESSHVYLTDFVDTVLHPDWGLVDKRGSKLISLKSALQNYSGRRNY